MKSFLSSPWKMIGLIVIVCILIAAISLVVLFIFAYSSVGFGRSISDDYAPGCVDLEIPGGCFNTTMIKQLEVKPVISCLAIRRVVGCNSPTVLEVVNKCQAPLSIAGLNLPDESLFQLAKDASGRVIATAGDYQPTEDVKLTAAGKVGEQNFTISYIKTISCP